VETINKEIELAVFSTLYFNLVKILQELLESDCMPSSDLIAYAGKLGNMAELPPEVMRGLELLKDGICIY
jgi:hypothetical protein